MHIGEYELINESKYERAVNGTTAKGGILEGGVGEGASDEEKLAAYDRLGGLILYDGRQVKMGSFWDFVLKVRKEKPEVVLVFKDLEGNVVELGKDDALPPEIRAAEKINKEKKAKKIEKITKAESKKIEKQLKKIKKQDEE